MKKLLLLLLPLMGFAQEKLTFDFDSYMKDSGKSVKSVTVMDERANKSPMQIKYRDDTYIFDVPSDINAQVAAKFDKDNKQKGGRNIVVMLEDLSVFENNTGKRTVPGAHFRASTFEQKSDEYYYLTTMDKNVGTLEVQPGMTPKYLTLFFKSDLTTLLSKSFSATPSKIAIAQADLPSYYSILSAKLPAFTAAIKDGVYESGEAFFNQTPSTGFVIEKNNDGKVQRARNASEKLPASKIWAYVEDGKVYKNTFSGFMPVQKNDKGYFIIANRGELEMIPMNSTYGMFGLVGGIAGVITQNAQQKQAKKTEKKEIYLDPLTGAYIY